MPKLFFKRRSKAKDTTETTPVKSNQKLPAATPNTIAETPVASKSYDSNNNSFDDDDDDESEEPWDVIQQTFSGDSANDSEANSNTTPTPLMRRKIQERMSRLHADESQDDDDEMEPRMLRLGKRTVKPLSPPARNNNNSRDSGREYRETPEFSSMESKEDEMPEDEKQDYLGGLCGVKETTDVVQGNGTEDNFCDYTLTAMNDICGTGVEQGASKKPDPVGKTVASRSLPRSRPPYGVEEQTAIEVEYIEPERRQDAKSDVSSAGGADANKKNRLVQAMAKRAKQDFEKEKGMPAKVSSPTSNLTQDGAVNRGGDFGHSQSREGPAAADNIYSSFSSSEKRKFLKLINSGLTPSDATAQVLKEREAGRQGAEEEGTKEQTALWKKGAAVAAVGATAAAVTKASRDKDMTEEEQFAKSGINYYDGVAKEPIEDDEEDAVASVPASKAESVKSADKPTRKPTTRVARLAKFGFGRPKGQPLNDQDDPEEEEDRGTARGGKVPRDPPPTVAASPRGLPPTPPRPVNTSRSAPANEEVLKDLDAVAESRSVFKPINTARSPEPEDSSRHEDVDEVPAVPSSMSMDSLLDEQGENEPEIAVAAAPETDYYGARSGEEKEEITADRQREEQIVAARLLGQRPAAPVPEQQVSVAQPAMITKDLDLDVETAYMNSTEIMSQYNGTSVAGDQTVKTQGTYGTIGTNYTTSTRTRRPGASKQRLSSQKTGETAASAQKYRGWQASIQEAAVGIGRVWDPVKGWVDYKEPEDEKKDDDITTAEYRSVATIPEHAPGSVSSPDSLTVLEDKDAPHTQAARSMASPSRPPRPSAKKGTMTPVKSRGWMETMKEATAKLNKDGKRWDPELGWVGPEDTESAPSKDRYRSIGVESQAESDTQDFGTLQAAQVAGAVASVSPEHQPREPSGQKPIHYVREDPSGEVAQKQQQQHQNNDDAMSDHQSVDASIKSGNTGRYIQIGDSGSVSSYYYGKPSEKTAPSKQMGSILESTSEKDEEGSTSDHQANNTLLVDVKKEKVDLAEASMFPAIPSESKGVRRGAGPVDLDEVDDQENASFGEPSTFSWDDDDFGSSTGGKKSTGGKSVCSVSTIPRLAAPKRDTSPIRGRGAGTTKTSSPQRELKTMTAPKQTQAAPAAQQVSPSPTRQTPATATRSPLPPVPPQKTRSIPAATVASASTARSPMTPVPSQKSRSDQAALVTPPSQSQPTGHGPDRSLKKSPAPLSDARSVNTAESSPSVNSVKELHNYWEKRSIDNPVTPPNAEWKSFLSKKVLAEKQAAENQKRPSGMVEDDRDTLFDFGSEGAFSGVGARQPQSPVARSSDPSLRQLEQISNLSPIRTIHDDDEDDDMGAPSEVSTEVIQGKTFMERIQACAAPMMPKQQADGANCNPMPLAHLNFMRNNSVAKTADSQQSRSSSKFVPPNLCGKPEVIVEEDDEDISSDNIGKQSPRKPPVSVGGREDVSSVISGEQFGQKTAYLEAIAMKAAVSGSKKNRRTRSSGSEKSNNVKHSESWQRFLDKKNAATSADEESVQRAAEEYAARKIDQMVAKHQAATFEARPMEEATGAFPSVKNANRFKGDAEWKTESKKAAEDLAAARVEAMMHALSSPRTLDEEEGEI